MSITKRYLEGDPSIMAHRPSPEDVGAIIDAHTFRLPGRRRNKKSKYPIWDAFYEGCLAKAGEQLGLRGINVNGAMRYRTAAERDAVQAPTETLWEQAHADFAARLKG